MKRGLMIGGFWFALVATILSGCKGMEKNREYQLNGIISKVCGDEVYVIDNRNEEFCFCGDGYKVGTKVVITFDDNKTENIYDDKILAVN